MADGDASASVGAFGALAATGMNVWSAGQDKKWAERQAREADARAKANSKEMTLFNKNQQLDLWKKTGPTGMMEEYSKAGLSPALMYGSSGAGGSSALSTATGQGTKADKVESYKVDPQIMANLALLSAQKENIEADTDNKRAELPVKGETARATQIENDRRQFADKSDGKTGLDIQRETERAGINWTGASITKMKQDVENAKEGLMIDWKNADTREKQVEVYKDIEEKKMQLELELFERGMNQRQIEFTVNKVFEGIDKVIQARSGFMPNTTRTYEDDSDGNWRQRSTTTRRGGR